MELGQAIIALHSWFGDGPFQIWQLDDSQVEQLVELTANRGATNIGRRSNIGRWLSSLNGNLIVIGSIEYSVTVVRRAERSQAGTYRIRRRTGNTDHHSPAPVVPKKGSLLVRLFRRLIPGWRRASRGGADA